MVSEYCMRRNHYLEWFVEKLESKTLITLSVFDSDFLIDPVWFKINLKIDFVTTTFVWAPVYKVSLYAGWFCVTVKLPV